MRCPNPTQAKPNLPTKCPQNEVHDKKCPDKNQGSEINPGPGGASRVVHLYKIKQNKLKIKKEINQRSDK